MFEMLLASDVGSLSWKRSAVLAIALHGAAVAVVTGGTDAPYERPLPRDTIRVDLRLAQAFRPRPWLQEPHQSPELPTPPAVVIPAMRFDGPVLDLRVATVAPPGPSSAHRFTSPGSLGLPPGRELRLVDSILSVTDVDRSPELAGEVRPRYPEVLQGSGLNGLVELEYVISSNGRVDRATMQVRTSPHRAFSRAAIDALADARFRPALRHGVPVPVRVRQSIRFLSR
jgi:protein TonB